MRILKHRDLVFALAATLIFFLIAVSVPVYDATNGLHNVFFGDYKIVWQDGRSPENFYIIKDMISDKPAVFPPDFVFRDVAAKDNYDFFESNGKYIPLFNTRPTYLFAIILKPFNFLSDLNLFKAISLLVVAFYSASLFVFYFVQRHLGLRSTTAFFSTLVGGIATSIFIYSHYFFLIEVVSTLFLFLFLYFVLKYWNTKSRPASYLLPALFVLFFFFFTLSAILFTLFAVVILYFIYYRDKVFGSLKTFIAVSAIGVALTFLVAFYLVGFENISHTDTWYQVGMFRTFSGYVNADDFNIYGFHDNSTQNRLFAYVYSFQKSPENAVFLHLSGLFGSLFGEKGFIYNSIFLAFSILGMFLYKNKEKGYFTIALIVLFVLILSSRFEWYGGVIPRYVRTFDIPILLLTFFSFYFIQENKSRIVLIIFIAALLISVLNVVSLAVRTDWTYEQHSQLISYDLILWPFPANTSSIPIT